MGVVVVVVAAAAAAVVVRSGGGGGTVVTTLSLTLLLYSSTLLYVLTHTHTAIPPIRPPFPSFLPGHGKAKGERRVCDLAWGDKLTYRYHTILDLAHYIQHSTA